MILKLAFFFAFWLSININLETEIKGMMNTNIYTVFFLHLSIMMFVLSAFVK